MTSDLLKVISELYQVICRARVGHQKEDLRGGGGGGEGEGRGRGGGGEEEGGGSGGKCDLDLVGGHTSGLQNRT